MRKILHVDLNNFYASVECLLDKNLLGKNVIVCGAPEDRHGIVLAKSKEAKALGIKTGMTIWEAKNLAPDLIIKVANFPLYLKYSKKVRQIFEKYTDFIEPFGIDESWLDVSSSLDIFGNEIEIAKKIIEDINKEIGLTVSVGVSYNKIFAKLGSDIAGINEIVHIAKDNYKQLVWSLPCEDLLYIGKATKKKLNKLNIFTIGDLANFDKLILIKKLGKWGQYLHNFAHGEDLTPVRNISCGPEVKSIGNSMTNYKDIYKKEDLKPIIFLLAESVVSRLRELGAVGFSVIHAHITKNNLFSEGWQKTYNNSLLSSTNLANLAYEIIVNNYDFYLPIRAVGISVSKLNFNKKEKQIAFFNNKKLEKLQKLEIVANKIQQKHGNTKFKKAVILTDKKLSNLDIKEEHIIHPESFFRK